MTRIRRFSKYIFLFSIASVLMSFFLNCSNQMGFKNSTLTSQSADQASSSSDQFAKTSGVPEVGVGITGLSYYDGAFMMTDVVRESEFRDASWGTAVAPDAQGAPTVDFLMIFTSGAFAPGTYKLQFKGKSTLSVAATTGSKIQNQVYDANTNTTTADVVIASKTSGNCWINFTNTRRTANSSSADGVSEIHLWRPGYATDGSSYFTAEFIQAMQKFTTIRTMDFTNTNGNPSREWADRTHIDYLGRVGPSGQSWELIILLANQTNRNIWINIPARASDDYILKLSQLFKYGSDGVNPYSSYQSNPVYPPLNPNLKVYLEFGNEVFNFAAGFNNYGWALADANTYKSDTSHPINYDGLASTNQYLALRRWIAFRSATISLTFRKTFGDSEMMTRIRPVLSTQTGNANVYLDTALQWAEGYYQDVTRLWYGGGGAAYYESSTDPTDTTPEVMTAYFNGLPSNKFAVATATDAIWTKGYGLKTVAYEGGPTAGGTALGSVTGTVQLCYTYNNDPRMKERMQVASDIWTANGGDLLNYYLYSGPAPWSFANGLSGDTVADTSSTKLKAVDAITSGGVAAATLGTLVPASIYLRDPATAIRMRIGGDTSWGYNGTAYRLLTNATDISRSETVLVAVRTTSAGLYNFALTTYDATGAESIQVYVNGHLQGTTQANTGVKAQATLSSTLAIQLNNGLNVIRIRPTTGIAVWIKDIVINP